MTGFKPRISDVGNGLPTEPTTAQRLSFINDLFVSSLYDTVQSVESKWPNRAWLKVYTYLTIFIAY